MIFAHFTTNSKLFQRKMAQNTPVKERIYDREFRQRSTWRWHKFDFVGDKNRDWEPETPPKMPTNNPFVDCLGWFSVPQS